MVQSKKILLSLIAAAAMLQPVFGAVTGVKDSAQEAGVATSAAKSAKKGADDIADSARREDHLGWKVPSRRSAVPMSINSTHVDICNENLANGLLNITSVSEISIRIENVPGSCMSVAAQYQHVPTNQTLPTVCGEDCLYYQHLSSEDITKLDSVLQIN
ncbi:hypothetical protein BX600DRAFT_554264 [Xylariales sp. PMI_506]|nr:hypothetical protein BX600DRAFT_554264 [Xylariales sp. PMI_506]